MRLVVAGGGTGGHIFPGIAVAKKFMERKGNEVLYVGTDMGMEVKIVPGYGIDLVTLRSGGVKGKNLFRKAWNILKVPALIAVSLKILKDFKADIVFGVGGYASYPVLCAAKLRGAKTAILEQNTMAGLANRALGLMVDRVYTTYELTKRFFPGKKVLLTGNPVREEILRARKRAGNGRFTVFVFGGSQGASNINLRMVEALEHLKQYSGEMSFIHQTGQKDVESVKRGYQRAGFEAEVFAFTDDMALRFARSDLIVARSGSGVSEIVAAGKPSILIPYPFSSYRHQDANADALVGGGAAIKFEDALLNGKGLADAIERLFRDRGRLEVMGDNAARLAMPRATEDIVDDLVSLGGR